VQTQMIQDLKNLELGQVIDYLLDFFTELTLTSRLFGNANVNLEALLKSLTIQLTFKFDQISELQNLKTGEASLLKKRLSKFISQLLELDLQNELTGDLLDRNVAIVDQVLELLRQITDENDFETFLDELLSVTGDEDNGVSGSLKLVITQKRKPTVDLEAEIQSVVEDGDFDKEEEDDFVGELEEISFDAKIAPVEDDEEIIQPVEPVETNTDPIKTKNSSAIKSNLKQPTNLHQPRTSQQIGQKPLTKPILSTKPVVNNRSSVVGKTTTSTVAAKTQINKNVSQPNDPVAKPKIGAIPRTSVIADTTRTAPIKTGQVRATLKVQTGDLDLKNKETIKEPAISQTLTKDQKVELIPDVVLEDIFANVNYISKEENEVINDLVNIESEFNIPYVEMPEFDEDTKKDHLDNPKLVGQIAKSKDFTCNHTKYYFSHNIVAFYMKSLIFRNSLFNEEIAEQIRQLKFKKEGTTAPRVFLFIKEQLWNKFEASILQNFKAKAMDLGLAYTSNFDLLKEEAYRYGKECLLVNIKKIFDKKMFEFAQDEIYLKIANPTLNDAMGKQHYAQNKDTIIKGLLEFLNVGRVPDMAKFVEEFIVMQTAKRYSRSENWASLFDDIKQYVITNKVESRDINMVKTRIEVFKIVKAALEARRQIFKQKQE
jgi:hypothetical protein